MVAADTALYNAKDAGRNRVATPIRGDGADPSATAPVRDGTCEAAR